MSQSSHGWLITHEHCLDGATAATIGAASGLTPIFSQPDRVANALAALSDDRPVYLADVSVAPAQWPAWKDRITWVLDHHQTALPLATEPKTTIDMHRCGSHLLYDYVVAQGWLEPSPQWQRLIEHVERYDLWLPDHAMGR
ncbi:MAG: phosphoesterase, partial [Firmicutes bacterium]|nr:phosphoesterase [Bacillota bacterium]